MNNAVLVLDDDTIYLRLVERILSGTGYDVITTENYRDFFFQLEQRPYNLIMLDVNMPEKDGFEIYTAILERHSTPVLFVTGYPGSFKSAPAKFRDLWQREFDKGRTDVLCKPFKIHDLHAKIEALVGQPA